SAQAIARLGRGIRLSILGTVFSKVDHRAPGCDLRNPGNEQFGAPPGKFERGRQPPAGYEDAPADGRTRILVVGAAAELAPATGVTQSRFACRSTGGTIWLLRSN